MKYQNNMKTMYGRLRLLFGATVLFCVIAWVEASAGDGTGKSFVLRQTRPEITAVEHHALGAGIKSRVFYAGLTDENNIKWFLTDAGMISGPPFDAVVAHSGIPLKGPAHIALDPSGERQGIWFGTSQGAFLASLPFEAGSSVTGYDVANSGILSNNILSVAVGNDKVRWFATEKGISALYNGNWLPGKYQIYYPEVVFKNFPITAMATSLNGDSLYAATAGYGVTRVFRNDVDAISGASQYALWGPINLPSDSVYSICITPDGTQWFGTTRGVARHTGFVTLENWTVFDTGSGLVNNFVQAIAVDKEGNIWCGTKGGLSVYDGMEWKSYTMENGLVSDNILFIITDREGAVFMGTDNGIMVYSNGKLDCYQ